MESAVFPFIPGFSTDYSVVLKPQVSVNHWLLGPFCDFTVTFTLHEQEYAIQTVPSSDLCWNCLILYIVADLHDFCHVLIKPEVSFSLRVSVGTCSMSTPRG